MFVQIKKEKHVGMLGGAIMATLLETEGELSRAQQLQTQTTGVLGWVGTGTGATSSRASWCPSRWMTSVGSTLRQMETEKVRGNSPHANRDSPKCLTG